MSAALITPGVSWVAGVSVAAIKTLPSGVGSGKEATMEFTYFPSAAGGHC